MVKVKDVRENFVREFTLDLELKDGEEDTLFAKFEKSEDEDEWMLKGNDNADYSLHELEELLKISKKLNKK